jgi:hypothetical protein
LVAPIVVAVKADLLALRPERFVTKWFAERIPAIFGTDQAKHISWKQDLADQIGVSIFDLALVGSAAVGLSLSPAKNFSLFAADSDVDVAVVSSYYFDLAWRWLRRLGAERYRLPRTAQNWVKEHESRLVYWGTIATDQLLPHMPFGPEWMPRLAALSSKDPVGGREVNVRLYRDFEALESYLSHGVRRLRSRLEEGDRTI